MQRCWRGTVGASADAKILKEYLWCSSCGLRCLVAPELLAGPSALSWDQDSRGHRWPSEIYNCMIKQFDLTAIIILCLFEQLEKLYKLKIFSSAPKGLVVILMTPPAPFRWSKIIWNNLRRMKMHKLNKSVCQKCQNAPIPRSKWHRLLLLHIPLRGAVPNVFFGKFPQMCEPTHPRVFVRFR